MGKLNTAEGRNKALNTVQRDGEPIHPYTDGGVSEAGYCSTVFLQQEKKMLLVRLRSLRCWSHSVRQPPLLEVLHATASAARICTTTTAATTASSPSSSC